MTWDAIKHVLMQLEEVLIRFGILLSVGFFLYDMLYHKFINRTSKDEKK